MTMKIAGSSQTIEVKAETQNIATEDATTGQVVDRRYINDLPIIDRNITDLTYLAPGVTNMDDQCPNCGGTNWVSNGSRGASADILMDGPPSPISSRTAALPRRFTRHHRKPSKSSKYSRPTSARSMDFRVHPFSI